MHVILTTVGNLVDLPKKTLSKSLDLRVLVANKVANKRSLVCKIVV